MHHPDSSGALIARLLGLPITSNNVVQHMAKLAIQSDPTGLLLLLRCARIRQGGRGVGLSWLEVCFIFMPVSYVASFYLECIPGR